MAQADVSVCKNAYINKCDLFPQKIDPEKNEQLLPDELAIGVSDFLKKNTMNSTGLKDKNATQLLIVDNNVLQICPPSNLICDKKKCPINSKFDSALSDLLDTWKLENDEEKINETNDLALNKSHQVKVKSEPHFSKESKVMVDSPHKISAGRVVPGVHQFNMGNTGYIKDNDFSDLFSDIFSDMNEGEDIKPKFSVAAKSSNKIGGKHCNSLSSNLSDMFSSMSFDNKDKFASNSSAGSSPDSGTKSCSSNTSVSPFSNTSLTDSVNSFTPEKSSSSTINNCDVDEGISMMDLYNSINDRSNNKLNAKSIDFTFEFDTENEKQTTVECKSNRNTSPLFDNKMIIDLSSCVKSKSQDIEVLLQPEERNEGQVQHSPVEPSSNNISLVDYPCTTKVRVNKHQSMLCKALSFKPEKNQLSLQKAKNIKAELYRNLFSQRFHLSISKSSRLLFLYNQSWDFKNRSAQKYS